jgi:hypothetical protein
MFGLLYPSEIIGYSFWQKNVFGYILGKFFTKSSGHPGSCVCRAGKSVEPEMCLNQERPFERPLNLQPCTYNTGVVCYKLECFCKEEEECFCLKMHQAFCCVVNFMYM